MLRVHTKAHVAFSKVEPYEGMHMIVVRKVLECKIVGKVVCKKE